MSVSLERFVQNLTESGLMSAADISSFQDSLPTERRPKDAETLARELVRSNKLTKYQVQMVYQGKTKGLVFGQYVVLDKLGKGGMGVVLKAQHRRMKRTVAIKVLSSDAMKQAGAIERFRREVEAAANLSHPNVVTAYDADEYQGMHYLAMEYVDGRDLAKMVKEQGPLGVQQAAECILQAARGLQYAHSKGIIHRDIKPGNLLLDKDGTVKVLDMGLARIAEVEADLGGAERLTTAGQVMGTCDYMAPEQSLDTHQADARADVYSLGCTLYRLLTGNPPYEAESSAKLFLLHLKSPIPSLCTARPEVPEALDAICRRMLAKKPEDRYQSMAEVIAELEAFLGWSSGRLPAAGPATPEEPPSEASSETWAFLQEVAPRGALTQQKKPAATERTQPHAGPEHDTGSKGKEDRSKGKEDRPNLPVQPSLVARPTNLPSAPRASHKLRLPRLPFPHKLHLSPFPPLRKARAAVARVRRKTLLLAGLAGGLVLLLGIGLAIAFRPGTLVVDIDRQLGKDVQLAVSQGGEKVDLVDASSGWRLSLGAGTYDLAVERGDDDFQLESESVTVTRGGQVKVRARLKPARLAVAPFDAQQAAKYQERWALQLDVPAEISNSIGMKLVLIPPGEFMMGSPRELIDDEWKTPGTDQWYKDHLAGEGPQHRVRITKPFYLGIYKVTQEEYQHVVGTNPSGFSAAGMAKDKVGERNTRRFPVEQVSWDDAVEFCRKLSEMPKEKAAGRTYRLPSEAQWEHACRAGSTGRFSFNSGRSGISKESEDKQLADYGWFGGNSAGMTHVVGMKRANAWGLYDMHGNVWDWCQDWYNADDYVNAKPLEEDPTGPPKGLRRAARGGTWDRPAWSCRSACRGEAQPGFRLNGLGFRVLLVLPDKRVERAAPPSPTTAPTAAPGSPAGAGPSPFIGPDGEWKRSFAAALPAVAPFDATKAKQHQEAWSKHLGVPVEIANSIGMKLVLIPPGEFTMGSPKELIAEELKTADGGYLGHLPGEAPQHRVRITRPFYLGMYAVTQEEYQRVMGANPSAFSATGVYKDKVAGQDTKRLPVENVSWDEAVEFCRRLSQMPGEKAAGRTYRLPSEAQWEYACRAGSTGRFSFSSSRSGISKESEEQALSAYAWFKDNAGEMTHAVGGKRPSAWGLHEMHGNVWEWCQDWYENDYYARSPTDDPAGPPGGSSRVFRGGSWERPAAHGRSARRYDNGPGYRSHNLGFRVLLVLADA